MGDVTDLDAYRDSIREAVTMDTDESITPCPECGDTMMYVVHVPELTGVEEENGPYAIICQHCMEPVGFAYMFEPNEDEDG